MKVIQKDISRDKIPVESIAFPCLLLILVNIGLWPPRQERKSPLNCRGGSGGQWHILYLLIYKRTVKILKEHSMESVNSRI